MVCPIHFCIIKYLDKSSAPANSNGASTGAAIFGSSPVPSHPIMPSTMGNTSDRTISTPSPVPKLSGGQTSEDQFKQTTQSDWTAMWPQESNNAGMTTTSTKNNFTTFVRNFHPHRLEHIIRSFQIEYLEGIIIIFSWSMK